MTDEELNEIKSHLTDNTQNWNMLLAQSDRIKLLAEVDRLREQVEILQGKQETRAWEAHGVNIELLRDASTNPQDF